MAFPVYGSDGFCLVSLVADPRGTRIARITASETLADRFEFLAGAVFPDPDAALRAVRAALDGHAGDTLDLVNIDRAAYDDWLALSDRTIRALLANGVTLDPATIPMERARTLPDGQLEIFLEHPALPQGRLSMLIPPDRWTWRFGPPS